MPIESQENTRTVNVFFVGNSLVFSDTVLRLANAEMPCMAFARTASLNELMFITHESAQAVRIIIVDETAVKDLVSQMPRLRQKFPQANFVLAYRKVEVPKQLLAMDTQQVDIGEIGFLPMNLHIDSWLAVLRLFASGEYYVPAEVISRQTPSPATDLHDTPDNDVPESVETDKTAVKDDIHLTDRELQVLQSAAEGKQNKCIAEELNLSQHTVKLHMHHVIAKLGVHNRTEAAIWYLGRNTPI